MPHFISKNMFLDVNSAHNDFFIMPYFTNISHPNIKILPVVLESKESKRGDFKEVTESTTLQNLDSKQNLESNLQDSNKNMESNFKEISHKSYCLHSISHPLPPTFRNESSKICAKSPATSKENENLDSKNLQNTESRFHKNNEFSNLDSKKLQNLDSKSKVIFIRCVCRNDTFLYKIDKITQIKNLAKLKEILSFLASKTQVISHNLAPSKKHSKGANSAFLLKGRDLQNLKPHFIEIGFGSGRHILNLAKNHPNKIILGFEIHAPSIRQVLNAIKLQNLSNLYICALDARNAIELIESSVVERIFVHFPVPWNSAKHRRVISPEFLESSFRILGRGGLLHLRSDDFTYVRDSIDELLGLKCVDFSVRKNASSEVISKYEARWSRQKKDIFDLFIKKPLDYCEDLSVESENFAFEFDFTITDLRAFCNQKWVDSKIFISLGDIYELQNLESRFYENNEFNNLDSKKLQNLDSINQTSLDSKQNIESNLQRNSPKSFALHSIPTHPTIISHPPTLLGEKSETLRRISHDQNLQTDSIESTNLQNLDSKDSINNENTESRFYKINEINNLDSIKITESKTQNLDSKQNLESNFKEISHKSHCLHSISHPIPPNFRNESSKICAKSPTTSNDNKNLESKNLQNIESRFYETNEITNLDSKENTDSTNENQTEDSKYTEKAVHNRVRSTHNFPARFVVRKSGQNFAAVRNSAFSQEADKRGTPPLSKKSGCFFTQRGSGEGDLRFFAPKSPINQPTLHDMQQKGFKQKNKDLDSKEITESTKQDSINLVNLESKDSNNLQNLDSINETNLDSKLQGNSPKNFACNPISHPPTLSENTSENFGRISHEQITDSINSQKLDSNENAESKFYQNNEFANLDSKEVTESTNKDSKKTQNLDSKDSNENIESKLQNLDSINNKNAAVQIIELTLGSFQVPFNTYLIIKSKESNEAPKSQTNNTTKETTKSNENHASKANQESQVKNTSKETQESQVKNTSKDNPKTQINNANKENTKTKQTPKSYTLSYLNAPLNIKSHKLAHIFLCKILNNKLDSNIIH